MTNYKDLLIQARDALLKLTDCGSVEEYGKAFEAAMTSLQAAIDAPVLTFYANDEFIAEFYKGSEGCMVVHTASGGSFNTPLYTRPASAKPLTDEQIEEMAITHEDFGFGQVDSHGISTHGFSGDGLRKFARAVEAAHGITEVKP